MVSLNTQLISLELFNTVPSYFYELVIGSADKATIFFGCKGFYIYLIKSLNGENYGRKIFE